MAAELIPPAAGDGSMTSVPTPPTTAGMAEPPTLTIPSTAVATTASLLLPNQLHNDGHLRPAPKRQRRPSVRLGEIGDQPATLSYEPHHQPQSIRRAKHQSCRHLKEPASSKSVKARSLINLVNGNDVLDPQELEGTQNGDMGIDFGQKRKAKRGSTKRARSSWVSKTEDFVADSKPAREEKEEEQHEGFREFDPDSDSQLKVHDSPLHSFDNNDEDELNVVGGEHWGRRIRAGGEGVRSWLIELGLSRYTSVFEVHEVDDEVLPFLTLEDLKDMGINAVGSRRKLYSAIQKLRKGYS